MKTSPIKAGKLVGYHQIISEATGITDPKILEDLEDIMRHDIFHSTLDWQSRDQLKKGAKEALELYKELQKEGYYPTGSKTKQADQALPSKATNAIVSGLVEMGADNKSTKLWPMPSPGSTASHIVDNVRDKLASIFGDQNVDIQNYATGYVMSSAQGDDHDEKEYGFEVRIPGYHPYYFVIGFKYIKGDSARMGFAIGSGKFQIYNGHRNVF